AVTPRSPLPLLAPRPPRPPLFPYTTLFRSELGRLADALGGHAGDLRRHLGRHGPHRLAHLVERVRPPRDELFGFEPARDHVVERSEEHTSELQSPYDLVCRLLLEKKKKYDH